MKTLQSLAHFALDYKLNLSSEPYVFEMSFKKCTQEPSSLKKEVYRAAAQIANQTKKPIWLCSSGGIDSEVMCRAFYDQKIPFKVLSLRQDNDTNAHDIRYAIEWCKANGVHHKLVDFNTQQFLEKDIFKYVDQGYVAAEAYYYLQIRLFELVEEMGGYAVLAGGEQLYKQNPFSSKPELGLIYETSRVACLEWCKNNNVEHWPAFYFTTPEIIASYLKMPVVQYFLNNPETLSHPKNTYILKQIAYQITWNDLPSREKFHGFEKVGMMTAYTNARLRKTFGKKIFDYFLSVKDLESQLLKKN